MAASSNLRNTTARNLCPWRRPQQNLCRRHSAEGTRLITSSYHSDHNPHMEKAGQRYLSRPAFDLMGILSAPRFRSVLSHWIYHCELGGLCTSLPAASNHFAIASHISGHRVLHYHLTLSNGVKKHQYEGVIRSYIARYHETWRERRIGRRTKLFKPLRHWLDKWARELR